MKVLLWMETKNYQKVRDILLKDDVVSRASIIFKEAKTLGKEEGYYCFISGPEEQCKRALEIVKLRDEAIELAKEVKNKEKENLIKKIEEEEEKANEAFGEIFS